MANLTDSTNLTGTIMLEKPTGTKIILDTDQKYLTKDIELTINAPTTTATAEGTTVSYGTGWITGGSTTITDENLLPDNIAEGVTIFGVTGTYNGVLIDETQDQNGGVITTITTGVHHIKTQGKIGIEPLTTSQTIRADSGYDALSSVQINPIPSSYIIPEGTKSIIENGETDVTEYKKVEVNVQPALQEKTITPSSKVVTQNITPDTGYYGLSKVVVKPIPSQYIIPNGTYEITENGYTNISGYAEVYVDVQPPLQSKTITPTKSTQIVAIDDNYYGLSSVTVNAIPTEYIIPTGSTTITNNGTANITQYASVTVNVQPTLQTKTATPSETAQEITPGTGYDGLSKVTVAAISNTYVGSNISRNDSTSLTASGATVTVPAGYYATQATKSVATATQATPTISVGADGVITATATQTAGYVAAGEQTAEYELNTQAAVTITPSTTEQTAVAANKYTTGVVKVAPIPSNYIVPTGTKTITENGTGIDVAQYATVDVNIDTSQPLQAKTHIQPLTSSQTISADTGYYGLSSVQIDAMPSGSATTPATSITANPSITIDAAGLITSTVSGSKSVTPTIEAGYVTEGIAGTITVSGSNTNQLSVQAAKTVTPTEEEQTAVTAGKYTTGAIKVAAISSTYIGSDIPTRDATNVTISGATITVPEGYYSDDVSKSVASATHGKPTLSLDSTTGVITASHVQTAGYVAAGTTSDTLSLPTQTSATITPTETAQVAVAAGKYTLGAVNVVAISSTYVGSEIDRRDSTDLTASEATITVPAGYYEEQASKAVTTTTHPKPSISVNTTTGLITASHTQTSGYVSSGTTSDTTQLTTKAAATITPTESEQVAVAANTYTLGQIKVGAISSTYVGSDIPVRDETDLTASGATVTVPAGYYASQETKSVTTMTLPTAAASSATSGYTSKATIGRSTSAQYINIPPGYNSAGGYYTISATPNGTVTAPSSISGTSASITTGTNTITLTKTVSVTPNVSTAGYISSGTAGNSSVSLTASVTVNPTPTASGATVTIPAGYYSAQTTKSVSSGSATGPSTVNGTSATITTGTNTITLTKTNVTTTPTVSAGYVSAATASTATVTLTANVTTKAAATITPGTQDQTIASGTYLTGTQTIAGDADLVASNIISTANIFGVQGSVVINKYYTGSTAPSSSLGNNGDIYFQE